METEELVVETRSQVLTDLTPNVRAFCGRLHASGLVNIFVPHATAGLAIIELGDGSEPDFARLLDSLFPKDIEYHHEHGTPGHGADHLVPTLLAPSIVVPVIDGEPRFGAWQHLVLVDRNPDNPVRRVLMSFVPG
jgi:secondary thiamine-phosphate synthase enzyme